MQQSVFVGKWAANKSRGSSPFRGSPGPLINLPVAVLAAQPTQAGWGSFPRLVYRAVAVSVAAALNCFSMDYYTNLEIFYNIEKYHLGTFIFI